MKMNFILPSANDFLFRLNSLVLEHDIVGAALNDGGGGHDGQARVLLKIRNVQHTAVAHGGAHLVQRGIDIVLQRTRVGHIGIDALFKGELRRAAHIIPLPVARAC